MKDGSTIATGEKSRRRLRAALSIQRQGMVLVLLILVIVGAILSRDFLSLANLRNILRQVSIVGVLAAGQTFVILVGGIDLSVGNLVSLTGALAAGYSKMSVPLGIFVGVVAGGLIGLVNGLVVAKARVQAFVVTLGTMSISQGLALLYTNGYPIFNLPPGLSNIGSSYIAGIPVLVVIMLVVYAGCAFALRLTKFGSYLYSLGGNEEATRLSGIRVDAVKVFAFVISGTSAGLAGVMFSARIATALPTMGAGYELQTIAAVVVGGTSLAGGRGGVFGTLIGTLIIGVLYNVLNLMNVSAFWQYILVGTVIITAAVIYETGKRYKAT